MPKESSDRRWLFYQETIDEPRGRVQLTPRQDLLEMDWWELLQIDASKYQSKSNPQDLSYIFES